VARADAGAEQYRYLLRRRLSGGSGCAVWVMLNPSTADDRTDDPTIRRCLGFTRRWGLSKLLVANLYAWRATRPPDLWRTSDPVGADNDRHLEALLRLARVRHWLIICAWGGQARPDRVKALAAMMAHARVTGWALGTTRAGHPRHPLYVPYGVPLRPW
jgi:hypothetical protein